MKFLYTLIISVLILLLSACGPGTGVKFDYKPPVVPLEVSVDTNGRISVSVSHSIVTPVGTFSVGAFADPAEYFKAKRTLIVRLNGQDTIYALDGEDFDVSFESGYYEKIRLEKSGRNILLELRRMPIPKANLELNCPLWNLLSDINLYPNQENPNRDSCGNLNIWYFMGSASLARDPQTYSLLSNFYSDAERIAGLQAWEGNATQQGYHAYTPVIGVNTTGSIQHPAGTVTWLPNTISVHPAPNQLLVIGWRSPINGTVRVNGSVSDNDNNGGDGISWFIDKGYTNLASGGFKNGGAQNFLDGTGGSNLNSISISRGEFMYFIVHPKGDYTFDSTRLDFSIIAIR